MNYDQLVDDLPNISPIV